MEARKTFTKPINKFSSLFNHRLPGGEADLRCRGINYSDTNKPTLNSTLIYNSVTGSWSSGVSMPTARWGLSLVNVKDTLYALGGQAGTNWLTTNEMYTPANCSWQTLPSPLPSQSPAGSFSHSPSMVPSNSPRQQPTTQPLPPHISKDLPCQPEFAWYYIITGIFIIVVIVAGVIYPNRLEDSEPCTS